MKIFLLGLITINLFAFSTENAVKVNIEEDKTRDISFIHEKISDAKFKKAIINDSNKLQTKFINDISNNTKLSVEKQNTTKNIKFSTSDHTSEFGSVSDVGKKLFSKINKVKNSIKEIKKYPDIKYIKSMSRYSIYNFNFMKEIGKVGYYNVSEWEKNNLNRFDTPKLIFLNALYYDKVKKDPTVAEWFYLKLKDDLKGSPSEIFRYKMALADYLLRTGRVKKIDKILNSSDCISFFKTKNVCFYYKGISVYAKTGDNKNTYIRLSKGTIPLSRKLYYKK